MNKENTSAPIVRVHPPGNTSVAAATMVYESPRILEKWVRYYGECFGRKNLFVLSHGECHEHRVVAKGCNFIVVPRELGESFDWQKSSALSSLVNLLLNFYGSVVCGDCDELVIVDPSLKLSLADYINTLEPNSVVAPVGLNLLPGPNYFDCSQPYFKMDRPALSQCKQLELAPKFSKPTIMRGPIRFAPGQHSLFDSDFKIDYSLYICHLKFMVVELVQKYEDLADEMNEFAIASGNEKFVPAWRKGIRHLHERVEISHIEQHDTAQHPGDLAKKHFTLYRKGRFLRVKELPKRIRFRMADEWLGIV